MAKVSDAVTGGSAAALSHRKAAILSFVSRLQKRLTPDGDDPTAAQALLCEIQKHAQTVESYSEKQRHDLLGNEAWEREGTNLWNLCARLSRECVGKPLTSSTVLQPIIWGRILSFHILHLCQWSAKSTFPVACHLMKLALKVVKLCIDERDVKTARLILQKAADYHGRLQDLLQITEQQEDADECAELEVKWTVLRMALAWQDDQIVVAEHLSAQADDLLKRVKPASSEKIIDLYFQIGKGMLLKEEFFMAEKWLQRAWDAINGQKLENISRDAVELRMAILQSLVTALLGLQTTDSIEKADNLVKYVESEIGDQPVILLLSLDILSRSPGELFDSEAYAGILRRMIRTFRPSEPNFKLVVHHARRLHAKSPDLGCSILDDFLASLVKTGQNNGWIDKAVVTRIFMATTQPEVACNIDKTEKSLSRLEQSVSADASFSAQTLIWKRIEADYSQGQYDMVDKWCRLALCPAFANSGPMNQAKVQRKLLLCAIARNDLDSAISVYYSMPEEIQKDPKTQYLLFKVTVRSGDRHLAAECLEALAKASTTKLDLLYACVADAQQAGDRLAAIGVMKRLAEAYELGHPGPVHLPALLRCMIMLSHGLLENGDETHENFVVATLCTSFETVVKSAQKIADTLDGKRVFDVRELEWFCQNSYNLGLKHAGDWDLHSIVRILNACVKIMQYFPDDVAAETAADLSLKSIFCHFLISSALVAIARSRDNLEEQLQDYLLLRTHVAAADAEVQKRLNSQSLDEVASQDLLRKLALLLAFDFEAAVALKYWQELGEIVLKASACEDVNSFKTMADCLLRSRVPPEELFSVLRKIINQISTLADCDSSRLAKYTRCLFQAVAPSNEELGGRLLDEACQMARAAHGTPGSWPSEELEWMASVAYNHAIDLWGQEDGDGCRWWAQKAISLAHYCNDDSQLETMLQDKYVKLKLDKSAEDKEGDDGIEFQRLWKGPGG